jgi:preprotein translocase subunit YajC
MFSSVAFAQEASSPAVVPPQNPIASFLPLVLICVVFYFLLIRPQQRKYKQHQEMIGAVKRGDRVVTGGGIIGTVTKVEEESDLFHVEIAPGVVVKVSRNTVSGLADAAATVPANDAKSAARKPAKTAKASKDDGKTANDN